MIKKIDYNKKSLELHKKFNGKLEINLKTPIKTKDDLSIVYSPGVAAPCLEIKKIQRVHLNLYLQKKVSL